MLLMAVMLLDFVQKQNEATKAAIDEIAETKEKVELELQKSQMLIDTSDGIKVIVNPNY